MTPLVRNAKCIKRKSTVKWKINKRPKTSWWYNGCMAWSSHHESRDRLVVVSLHVTTLSTLFTRMCFCHQAVQFGTAERAMTLCPREGNRGAFQVSLTTSTVAMVLSWQCFSGVTNGCLEFTVRLQQKIGLLLWCFRTYFAVTAEYTQRSINASWLCAI